METIKIIKWDKKDLHYACDTDDSMDMCIYIDGQKIKIDPSESKETENWKEHTFTLDEETTEELGAGKHKYSIRVNWETAEKGTFIISNWDDEEDNND